MLITTPQKESLILLESLSKIIWGIVLESVQSFERLVYVCVFLASGEQREILLIDLCSGSGNVVPMNSYSDKALVNRVASRLPEGERFLKAIESIDRHNERDPKRVSNDGVDMGYEFHFSCLLFVKVLSLREDASEALLIAARSQHICRWESPRSDYPEGRAGYLKWRADLKRFHADKTESILAELGYPPEFIETVRAINLKKDLKSNPDSQTMEDALCLVFLESQFPDFRVKTSEEKMVSIIRKTWAKMSAEGQKAALNLNLRDEEARLVGLALKG